VSRAKYVSIDAFFFMLSYYGFADEILSIRPHSEILNGITAYAWSKILQNGMGFELQNVQDGETSLLNCSPCLKESCLHSNAIQSLSFSMMIEYDKLAGSDIYDVKLVVQPPLIIKNEMPMHVDLVLEEKSTASMSQLVSKSLKPGDYIEIYNADMQKDVCFKVDSDEYLWAEKSPVPLYSCSLGAELRRSARLCRPDSNTPVEIYIARSLKRYCEGSDAAAVTNGASLTISLFSPLWIANSTNLPVHASIVSISNAPVRSCIIQKCKYCTAACLHYLILFAESQEVAWRFSKWVFLSSNYIYH